MEERQVSDIDEAPMSLHQLIQYAKALTQGNASQYASPSDWPDDIASLLGRLEDGAELDAKMEESLRAAYEAWEDEDFLVDVTFDDEDDDYPEEGPSSLFD